MLVAKLTPHSKVVILFAHLKKFDPLARNPATAMDERKVMGIEVALQRPNVVEGPVEAAPGSPSANSSNH
jgi:hypothetical protein